MLSMRISNISLKSNKTLRFLTVSKIGRIAPSIKLKKSSRLIHIMEVTTEHSLPFISSKLLLQTLLVCHFVIVQAPSVT